VPEIELSPEKLKKSHGFIRLRFAGDSDVDAAPAGQEQAKYGKDMQGIRPEQDNPAISDSCNEDAAPAFPIQGRVADLEVGAGYVISVRRQTLNLRRLGARAFCRCQQHKANVTRRAIITVLYRPVQTVVG